MASLRSDRGFVPANEAESLLFGLFVQLEAMADPQIARLHFEQRLRVVNAAGLPGPPLHPHPQPRQPRRPLVRPALLVTAIVMGLLLLGSWAGNLELPGWIDGQQITLALPRDFGPNNYPHVVAIFANNSDALARRGGHSLIVDYKQRENGRYILQLSLLGVDFSTANEWLRDVLKRHPDLAGGGYAITQPEVGYAVTVKEMLAYTLGHHSDAVERRVLQAWEIYGTTPSRNGMIYLIAQPDGYAKRVSMVR